jgi:hypothetical protein
VQQKAGQKRWHGETGLPPVHQPLQNFSSANFCLLLFPINAALFNHRCKDEAQFLLAALWSSWRSWRNSCSSARAPILCMQSSTSPHRVFLLTSSDISQNKRLQRPLYIRHSCLRMLPQPCQRLEPQVFGGKGARRVSLGKAGGWKANWRTWLKAEVMIL